MASLNKLIISLSLVGLAVPHSLLAQENIGQPDSRGDIVVIGNKEKAEIYEKIIANKFVVRGGGRNEGQYARFAAPICPSVEGFSDEQNSKIEARIREVISLAKLRTAKADCAKNMFIIAVADGAKTIKELRTKQSRLFTSLSRYDRDKLMNSAGPVFAWKSVQAMSSDSKGNARAGTIDTVPARGSGSAPGASASGAQNYRGQRSHIKSKIMRSTIEGIRYSYLLIESSGLKGVTPKQLADHVTMLSLIDMKQDSGDEAPPPYSILSLFDQNDPELRPASIGDVDIALLNALYKSPANVRASTQRSAMVHRINEKLEKQDK